VGIYDFPDNALRSRVRRLESNAPFLRGGKSGQNRGSYRPVLSSAVDSGGIIDPTGSGIMTVGSLSPYSNTSGFAATSTSGAGAGTSSLSIFWDGTNSSSLIIINRADSSQFVVPPGSITISGLDPATTYYFLPFWARYGCQIGWVLGTVGSPQIAFSVATDTSKFAETLRQDREALTSGYMSFKTADPSVSNSVPAGGGGSSGRCVMTGTDISMIGSNGRIERHPQTSWYLIGVKGDSLPCTPNHPLYVDRDGFLTALLNKYTVEALVQMPDAEVVLSPARIDASEVRTEDRILRSSGLERVTETKPFTANAEKVSVHMPQVHLFWANRFLSHNYKEELI
jgi:hypothetical protein